jgi:uncharacterized protein (TIGR00255 family)
VLLSMTGFGEARLEREGLAIAIEVRAVNNRYLKVSVRGSEPYPMLEPELEKNVRKYIRRGTVTIHIRCERAFRPVDFSLNTVALSSYINQLKQACEQTNNLALLPHLLPQVLSLPGVVPEPGGRSGRPADEELAVVEATLEAALQKLHQMRTNEGHAMAEELLLHRRAIAEQLQAIHVSAPKIIENFRVRIRERVAAALAENQIHVRTEDMIREVAIFAERADVSEEITRLNSHLEQFETVVRKETDGPGRKLEFLVQEMGREANTIGSKAGDVSISRAVVEIKATLEKIRELVQNVE